MQNAAVILQARMASQRLPAKALARLRGFTLLEHCLRRLQQSGIPVVLATTDRPEDDRLEDEASRLGVQTFRGPSEDVLARFVQVARALKLEWVVRATGDNPAVDMMAPARVLALIDATGADHASETTLPYGAAVEAVSVAALERADRDATDPLDREHVTTLIRRDRARYRVVEAPAPAALRRPSLRFTIDTPDDLGFMRLVFDACSTEGACPSLGALILAAESLEMAEARR